MEHVGAQNRKIRLTNKSIDALPPLHEPYQVWDADLPCFGIRVLPSGKKTYFFKYRVGGGGAGRQRKPSIGRHGTITCEEARMRAREWALIVQQGGDPAADRVRMRSAPTVNDLCDRFWSAHVQAHLKPGSQGEIRRHLRRFIRPQLGRLKVNDVRRDDIARLHNRMIDTPYQANRVLSTLSKMFNLAEMWGLRTDGSNPCRHLRKFREGQRERFLARTEIIRLTKELERQESASPHFVGFLRIALLTGMRKMEILTLRWEYIDFDARRIDLPDSKTGKRSIPISAVAEEAIRRIPRVPGNPFVIAGTIEGKHANGIQKFWQRLRMRVGIEDVRIHDLRHTFASVAAVNGVSLYFIGHLLGHRQASTTARYAHLTQGALHDAATVISEAIRGVQDPGGCGAENPFLGRSLKTESGSVPSVL